MIDTPDRPYFSPEEFARIVGVHPNTVRRLTRSGSIPSVKIGAQTRIPASALAEFPSAAEKAGA